MKKIVIIDGQGGKIGAMLAERLRGAAAKAELYAIGTNSAATAAMLKAGAQFGATGENPVLVNCRDADIIVGPIGIVLADALLGEITPVIAAAVGSSTAQKVLLPVSRCSVHIAAMRDVSIPQLLEAAVTQVLQLL